MNRKQRRAAAKLGARPEKSISGSARSSAAATGDLLAAGLEHQRAGRLDEAERLYRKILSIDPRHSDSLRLLGLVAYRRGRFELAVEIFNQAIALNSNDPRAPYSLGLALTAQGKLAEAVTSYKRATTLKSDFTEAHISLGNVLKDQGNLAEAVASYQRALAIKPDFAEAHNNLGNALRAQGKLAEAVTSYQRAVAIKPDYTEAHNNLGFALQAQGKLADALAGFERALAIKPDFAEAHNNLGIVLKDQGKLVEAAACYQRALSLKPDYAEAHNNLGNVLTDQGKLTEAAASYQRAIAIKADYAEAHNNLGNALRDQGKLTEAVASYQRALAIKPDFVEAHYNLGVALREKGELEQSRKLVERAVELDPDNAASYRLLGDAKSFSAGEPHLGAMERMAREVTSLSPAQQIELHFALAKAYEDTGDYGVSFDHLLKGNALKRQQVTYDGTTTCESLAHIQQIFTAQLMRERRNVGDPSPVPVFVIGMPRSGTTLIEQILASHPRVFGAGELDDIASNVAMLRRDDGLSAGFPELVPSMTAAELRQFGSNYVNRLKSIAPEAQRITDKMPINFVYAGLIHLVLPHARIIHARRDPLDTCLSCFATLFAKGQQFTYDLAELGQFYRAYDRLMQHWRAVLPSGVMLEVQYEELVADLEGQARRIVDHCGLQWDEACLLFHETERPVRTASAVQVRQPIYHTSVGRWRRYERQLAPLIEVLGIDPANGAERLDAGVVKELP